MTSTRFNRAEVTCTDEVKDDLRNCRIYHVACEAFGRSLCDFTGDRDEVVAHLNATFGFGGWVIRNPGS